MVRYLPVLVLGASVAHAVTPATMVGPDLQAQRVNIQGLYEGSLSYFDASRELRTDKLEKFIQIRNLPGTGPPAGQALPVTDHYAPWFVELTDGQRLVGQWSDSATDGQALLWEHALLGRVVIKLDLIRTLGVVQAPVAGMPFSQESTAGGSDMVHLANGDTLQGLVMSLGSQSIQLRPAGTSQALDLPRERVRLMRLANPDQLHRPTGHLVWFDDESRLRGENLAIARDRLSMRPTLMPSDGFEKNAGASSGTGGEAFSVSMGRLERIDLVSRRGRLVDATRLKMTIIRGGRVFGISMPPRVEGDMIRLHAPVVVRFDLPKGASRFAAFAELTDYQRTYAEALAWVDLELIIRVDARIAMRRNLDAERPTAALNVPVNGDTLIIEADPAVNGPVMDRLTLRDAMVFVEYSVTGKKHRAPSPLRASALAGRH